MTADEITTRIAQILHRSDLGPQMANFVSDANERINRRFGTAFVVPVGTAPLPAGDLLYLYAALVSANLFLNNGDNARTFEQAWELECDRQNVLSPGGTVDAYTTEPPFIAGNL